MKPVPGQTIEPDGAWIEAAPDPHEFIDHDVELAPSSPHPDVEARAAMRLRLTRNDFLKYGFTDDCPKCANMQTGRTLDSGNHSEACRYRMYADFEKNEDPKWRRVRTELGMDDKYEAPPKDQIDLEAPVSS